MKRFLVITLLLVLSVNLSHAQDKLYILLELMKVDNTQESDYWETESFWEKIHQERANSGDIVGWDFWRLLPGGEDQGYQYATATLFSSEEAMFKGGDLWANAKRAYPNLSDDQLERMLNNANETRDLAVRIYMETIAMTSGDFQIKQGVIATFDWMKVALDSYNAYEQAERDVFMPDHQNQVNRGTKGLWVLHRFISPIGDDTYASHLTANMFNSWEDALASNDGPPPSANQQKAIEKGLATRSMRFVHLGVLEKSVRKM